MAKTIKVKGTGEDGRVVIFERNADHPNGECFVANNGKVVEVAETARVKQAIAEGLLTTEATRGPGRPPAKKDDD